jgi:hypothetical protein
MVYERNLNRIGFGTERARGILRGWRNTVPAGSDPRELGGDAADRPPFFGATLEQPKGGLQSEKRNQSGDLD